MIAFLRCDKDGSPIVFGGGYFKLYVDEIDAMKDTPCTESESTIAIGNDDGERLISLANVARRIRTLGKDAFLAIRTSDGRIVPLDEYR